jgi:DNA-binding transcriptional regulator GbsR (MarR family)
LEEERVAMTRGEIAWKLGLSRQQVSQCLTRLKEARAVRSLTENGARRYILGGEARSHGKRADVKGR